MKSKKLWLQSIDNSILIIAVILGMNTACTHEVPLGNDLVDTEIVPLAVGNNWQFRITSFDSLRNPSVGFSTTEMRIVGDTLINNETWYFHDQDYINHRIPVICAEVPAAADCNALCDRPCR